jgi:hypothetical protein
MRRAPAADRPCSPTDCTTHPAGTGTATIHAPAPKARQMHADMTTIANQQSTAQSTQESQTKRQQNTTYGRRLRQQLVKAQRCDGAAPAHVQHAEQRHAACRQCTQTAVRQPSAGQIKLYAATQRSVEWISCRVCDRQPSSVRHEQATLLTAKSPTSGHSRTLSRCPAHRSGLP